MYIKLTTFVSLITQPKSIKKTNLRIYWIIEFGTLNIDYNIA